MSDKTAQPVQPVHPLQPVQVVQAVQPTVPFDKPPEPAAAVPDLKGKGHVDDDADIFMPHAIMVPPVDTDLDDVEIADATVPLAPLATAAAQVDYSDITVENCREVFMIHNPGFQLDYEFSDNAWSMHVGSLRTVVKFFAFNKKSSFITLRWFMREVGFTQMFGTDIDGHRKLGPDLLSYHVFDTDEAEVFPEDVKAALADVAVQQTAPKKEAAFGVMVMERVDGTLEQIWPLLNAENRARMRAEIDGLLGDLHGRGYVHGDLHRGNIGYSLVQAVDRPVVHPILIDWGRCFKLGLSDALAAGSVIRHTPYTREFAGPVAEGNIRIMELAYWKRKADAVPYSLAMWGDKPRAILSDNKRPITTSDSAVFAYWFRQLFGWPIYGVFIGEKPVYYYTVVPAQPARFMDANGIETRDAVRKRFITTDYAALTIAPVDDMFSNVTMFREIISGWKLIMGNSRAPAISSAEWLNKVYLHVTTRNIVTDVVVARGFTIGKKATCDRHKPTKAAEKASSSSSSSSSSTDSRSDSSSSSD
jgi:hypothetical protein